MAIAVIPAAPLDRTLQSLTSSSDDVAERVDKGFCWGDVDQRDYRVLPRLGEGFAGLIVAAQLCHRDASLAKRGHLVMEMTEVKEFKPLWGMNPSRLALTGSTWRGEELPEPFCLDVGRRLLLAELEFSEWILRRIEKIDMTQDRSISRRISLEFSVRDDAPEFSAPGGRRSCLIPLSLMRRRTLVNLQLRDDHDRSVIMPGLRLTQQLDQSILLAAAASVDWNYLECEDVHEFIQLAVTGELPQVQWAYSRLSAAQSGPLKRLHEDPLFRWAAERFRHNFSLFTFIEPRDNADPGHSLINMSFDEPTDWRYQLPELKASPTAPGVMEYRPGRLEHVNIRRIRSALGIDPMRIRFQTPGAECAASYHFEIQAPPGVQIVKADLLAGRPNNPKRHVSEDQVVGHTPVIGLHAVEVPNGSLCRVQVDIGIPWRGWLSTVWISSIAITVVLFSVALHWHPTKALSKDQITNVVLILVTASAAVAGLIAQRDSGVLAARLVSGLRTLATASLVLPLFVAGLLTYSGLRQPPPGWISRVLWVTVVLSGVIFTVFTWAGLKSLLLERHSLTKESPWDQTDFTEIASDGLSETPPLRRKADFLESLAAMRFDTAAVGVRSAEGWHQRYAWSDTHQQNAMDALEHVKERLAPLLPSVCGSPSNRCGTCPGLAAQDTTSTRDMG